MPSGRVVPLEGPAYQATLVGAQSNGLLTFDRDNRHERLAAAELVAWGAPVEALRGPQWLLADGSLLVADVTESDNDRARLLTAFGEIELPLERVAGVLWHPPADRLRRDKLAARLQTPAQNSELAAEGLAAPAGRGNADLVILENGDELSGTVGAITAEHVAFEGPVGPLQIETTRITALAFNPGLIAPPAATMRILVGCRDGSLLAATQVSPAAGGFSELRIILSGDLELSVPLEAVVYLQTLGGRAEYLSDLPAQSYRHLPFLDLHWPYRLDANVLGGRLRSGGRPYLKGIGMHTAARLTYQLGKPYRRFEAELAIDDGTEGKGSVVFKVYVDENLRYESPIVRGGEPPLPISVNVTGGKRLSLIIDFADRADELDHANWLNPRLVP
ncbi:MAG: NPCBM/NEW2 domain-containing protein [Pirellulales bacterium]